MNYRTIFLEFLSNYREYHYDCLQLLLFEGNHNDNILKVLSDANLVDVYQVKGSQVYNKKLPFSSINNTIVNLLFVIEKPEVIEISKSDEEIKKFQDLYNSKTLYDLNYKYLIIYPIYQNQQLLGGLFIYSNYQMIWQIEESKLKTFIADLESAKCKDIIEEITNKVSSPYWSLVNRGVYINNPLAQIIGVNEYNNAFNFKGHSLELLNTVDYDKGKINIYRYIPKLPIFSSIEFDNLKLKEYSIIYLKVIEDNTIEELVNNLNKILREVDGAFGYYKIYQTDTNSLAVVYEKEINKKLIFDYFKLIPFTLIRSNHEINKIINFSVLREYLNLSPLEEFNNDYFEYYQQKLLLEKKNNVKVLYNTSKIKIVPYFNSINMNIEGYIVSDLFELKNATADVKLKSIKAISKIIEEYNNPIISISLEDMFNSGKPYLAYINCLKKVCSNGLKNVKILTNYDKEKIIKIKALWNEFDKYLYINEKDSNFYDLMLLEDINGICLSETEYLQVSLYYPNKSNEITEFWMNKTKKVFVYVKQNDIIKHHNEKILLILGE